MEHENNSNETEARLYAIGWDIFLVDFAFAVLGDGFYDVHPRNGKAGTEYTPRHFFSVLKGFSENDSVSRETISRWRKAMHSDDWKKASAAVMKCITYLLECAARVMSSEGVWWEHSDDALQFFRESDSGLSDKFYSLNFFFSSINAMGYYAPHDEYGRSKSCRFDRQEIERELPRLMGKHFQLAGECGPDGGEKEEWRIAASKGQRGYVELSLDLKPVCYDDGRYTLAARHVFAHWDADSGRSFFAWPIESFQERLAKIDGGEKLCDHILKKLFGEMKGRDGKAVDGVANIEDIMKPKELHRRKWTTFESCFAYYSRGLPGDNFPSTFPNDILGKELSASLSDEQLDTAFLAFLVFQSEMMAAFLLNNTLAVLRSYLSPDAVKSVLAVWRDRLPNGDSLPDVIL